MINRNKLGAIINILHSIYFNFKVLPFQQAIKLPIIFCVKPTFLTRPRKGEIIIKGDINRGMILLGIEMAPIYSHKNLRWQNSGLIIFNGPCRISNNSFICCYKNAQIIFGSQNSFSFNTIIIAAKEIKFGDKIRSSWNCTFIDTDFHPLIDMIQKKPIKQDIPIHIDYGCWIGHDCIITKGSKLCKNITVSSGSVVKGVWKKENCIIGGNIATLIDEGYKRDDV